MIQRRDNKQTRDTFESIQLFISTEKETQKEVSQNDQNGLKQRRYTVRR